MSVTSGSFNISPLETASPPTSAPTLKTTFASTVKPTVKPTKAPSAVPSAVLTTSLPSTLPINLPSQPSVLPSFIPTAEPTYFPTVEPTTSTCSCQKYKGSSIPGTSLGPDVVVCWNTTKPDKIFGVYFAYGTIFDTNRILPNPNFPASTSYASAGCNTFSYSNKQPLDGDGVAFYIGNMSPGSVA